MKYYKRHLDHRCEENCKKCKQIGKISKYVTITKKQMEEKGLGKIGM